MREAQKAIWTGLQAIGYKGRLTPLGFDDAEIAEIVQEEAEIGQVVSDIEQEYYRSSLGLTARQEAFYGHGVDREWAFEARSRFLKERYEDASRRFYESKLANVGDIENAAKTKAVAKLHYDIHLGKRMADISSQDIGTAHGVSMEKLIAHKHGFAICPFHAERTPSFHITKNFWYCHGCGEGGDPIGFIRRTKNYSFIEAVKYLISL